MARIFLAGASGIIGQRLVPLLVRAGHQVTGTTRTEARAGMVRALGASPVVVDVLEASLLARVMAEHAPEVVIHQLTSLPDHMDSLDAEGLEGAIHTNARMRAEGTSTLVAAATACGARRLVAQSILWIYAPGREPHVESDPFDAGATGLTAVSVRGVMALERAVLGATMASVVLRYGHLYGSGSGHDGPWKDPALHVDAAARAAFLAVDRGAGVYNVAESSPYASSARARRDLGFDAGFRC